MPKTLLHPLVIVQEHDGLACTMRTKGCRAAGPSLSSSLATDRMIPIQVPSHHRQRPVERGTQSHLLAWPSRAAASRPDGNGHIFMLITLLLAICFSFARAEVDAQVQAETEATRVLPDEIPNPLLNAPAELHAQLDELALTGTILFDQNPPSGNHDWDLQRDSVVQVGLRRRESDSDRASSVTGVAPAKPSDNSTSASPSTSATVASPSGSTTASASTTSNVSSPLPSPFDSSLGLSFSASTCPAYIISFLNNATFKSCLPFSMLLLSSNGFFQAEKSVLRMTQILDSTCAANVTYCATFLSGLASNLTSTANCGADFASQNAIVMQAYMGLITYKPLYQASCLKNPATGSYCWTDAVTNVSSPEDSFVYLLAANTTLPGGSQPTCNICLQNTMAVFSAAAANRSQPIANTYVAAAQQINVNCGPSFVNASIPSAMSAARGYESANPIASALVLATCIMAWLL